MMTSNRVEIKLNLSTNLYVALETIAKEGNLSVEELIQSMLDVCVEDELLGHIFE